MRFAGLTFGQRGAVLSTASVPAGFTYDLVGATRSAQLPAGWRHVDRTWVLPIGSFDAAARCVLSQDVLRGAGLRVLAGPLAAGSPVLQAIRLGPVSLLAPCRIAYVVTETDRAGFAYGTVAGHPERGEEAFLVRRSGDLVTLTIRSFTQPGCRLVALGWPIAGLVAGLAVARYAAAVHAAC